MYGDLTVYNDNDVLAHIVVDLHDASDVRVVVAEQNVVKLTVRGEVP